ncbi:MAG: hypothetical protein ACK4TA_05625 [Saprospiraceae bacterium]
MKYYYIIFLMLCVLALNHTPALAAVATDSQTFVTDSHKKTAGGRRQKAAKTTERSNPNKRGLLSVIFGGASLVLLWTPIGFISFFLLIAGLVLGILGLKRDAKKTLAIIGLILNIAMALLFLTAIILLTAWAAG